MADDGRNDAESEDSGIEAAETPEAELERTRTSILDRRNHFMAAALAGLGMATGGCSPCLSLLPPFDRSGDVDAGAPLPCVPTAPGCPGEDTGVEDGGDDT